MATMITKAAGETRELQNPVYCPLCTHTVNVRVTFTRKHARVTPGQKCPHCGSAIDAGYVLRIDRAA